MCRNRNGIIFSYIKRKTGCGSDPNAPKTMSIEPGDKLSLTFQKLIAIKSIELLLTKDQLEKLRLKVFK